MALVKLSVEEIKIKLPTLSGWSFDGKFLVKKFEFKNFVEAFGFMAQVALVAEKMDHHPDWLNVYNRLEVKLWTHDAQGITEKDFVLAKAMNDLQG